MNDPTDSLTRHVADLSERAEAEGTFGVGGVLIDKNGHVLLSMQNKVVPNGDPTAHVERQIVDWYFDQIAKGVQLPPPSELTIISSLDPCMMCTGSILSAKFNAVSMSHDSQGGVDYDHTHTFKTLPPELAKEAIHSFGYFGVKKKSDAVGPIPQVLDQFIDGSLAQRTLEAFEKSIPVVEESKLRSVPLDQLENSASKFAQPENSLLLGKIRQIDPSFLPASTDVGNVLIAEAKASRARGGSQNAAVLLDPFGNILMVQGGNENISPIKTPLMQLIRHYSQLRQALGDEGKTFLPEMKNCQIILLRGPGNQPYDIANMGAFGGTRAKLSYVLPSQPQAQLEAMLKAFPPLYRDVYKLSAAQVDDKALIQKCIAALAAPVSAPKELAKP